LLSILQVASLNFVLNFFFVECLFLMEILNWFIFATHALHLQTIYLAVSLPIHFPCKYFDLDTFAFAIFKNNSQSPSYLYARLMRPCLSLSDFFLMEKSVFYLISHSTIIKIIIHSIGALYFSIANLFLLILFECQHCFNK